MSTSRAPVIELEAVRRTFRERRRTIAALDGLTLRVERGEVYGLLGPNGAGKTTALHCLLGLLRPTSGSVRLFGEPLAGNRDVLRRVGYMPEDWSCYDFLTVREMLRAFADLYRLPPAEKHERVETAVTRVGLAEHGDRRLRRLSKGMRQRAALAQALLTEPDLLVLDEPTKELDPIGRIDVRVLVHELAVRGATILMSSHLLSEVEMVCDRVGVLHQGRLVAEGDLATLLAKRDSRTIRFTLPAAIDAPPAAERDGEGPWRWRAASQEELYRDLDWLSARGATLISVEPETLRLEDYFIQVISGP